MNLKRIFFTIVVLIIVLAFSASFFSAGIRSLINNDEEESTSEQQPSGIDEQSDELSPFIQSIKSSMVQSPETSENANSIAKAINVYNSLTEQDSDKILSFDGSNADFNSLKSKLVNMSIYFDEIVSDIEKEAWEMIIVDAQGVASVK